MGEVTPEVILVDWWLLSKEHVAGRKENQDLECVKPLFYSVFQFHSIQLSFNFHMVSELSIMADHSTNVTPLQDSGEIPTSGSGLITGQTTSQMTNQSFTLLG